MNFASRCAHVNLAPVGDRWDDRRCFETRNPSVGGESDPRGLRVLEDCRSAGDFPESPSDLDPPFEAAAKDKVCDESNPK
jgi:hypothetical protein